MDEMACLLSLLAEAEAVLTRETEAILAGHDPDPDLTACKDELLQRLEPQLANTTRLTSRADTAEHRRLCAGFDRLVQAAVRNDAVLRGALRGSCMVVHAMREAGDGYPGRHSFATHRARQAEPASGFDRIA